MNASRLPQDNNGCLETDQPAAAQLSLLNDVLSSKQDGIEHRWCLLENADTMLLAADECTQAQSPEDHVAEQSSLVHNQLERDVHSVPDRMPSFLDSMLLR
jgi:hypothetical protein